MAQEKEPRGFRRYLRAAFLQPWNLLLFFGSIGMTVVTGTQDLAPFIMAAEMTYLAGLASMPRFRTAIDAKINAKERAETEKMTPAAEVALQRMVASLPNAGLRRFLSLRQRCYEMRDIAAGIRGHAQSDTGDITAEAMRNSSLDRLLYLFLKLLVSQSALERFLNTTSERELELRLQDVQARKAQAQAGGDERIVRSLQDSEADATLRLENYRNSLKDAEFVNVELDRIETKIRTLVETAVSRQDADTLSVQVTAAADSMKQTEDAVRNLQHLTGIESALEETPPILAADMGRVLSRDSQ
ncbi:MAG TPA: hypothetical protein VH762_19135 [Gemmatimonadaceae bacterium]|jgi:hypothetical protein